MMTLVDFFRGGSNIHIKKSHEGKFTSYCGGKVTGECIAKGKRSPNAAVRKQATFAANARKWKHSAGCKIEKAKEGIKIEETLIPEAQSGTKVQNIYQSEELNNQLDTNYTPLTFQQLSQIAGDQNDNNETQTNEWWNSDQYQAGDDEDEYITSNAEQPIQTTTSTEQNPDLLAAFRRIDFSKFAMYSQTLGANYVLTHQSHGACTTGPEGWWNALANSPEGRAAGLKPIKFWNTLEDTDSNLLHDNDWEIVYSGYGADGNNYTDLKPGDIAISFAYKDNGKKTKHALMWTGSDWRSDFIQNNAWVYNNVKGRNGDHSFIILRNKKLNSVQNNSGAPYAELNSTVTNKSTRGYRNNNPLNLRLSDTQWEGKKLNNTDGAFEQFDSMAFGYRAAFMNAAHHINGGLNTLRKLINVWAPSSDGNDPDHYAKMVAQQTGLNIDQIIDPNDSNVMPKIVAAMAKVENGSDANESELMEGWNLYLKALKK